MIQALIGPATKLLGKFIADKDTKNKIAFAYHFIIKDLIMFICGVAGLELPDLPEFDMGTLLTVLGGMLGIGSLRTYEKQKGLTK